jgi:PAS domain S-box-containing protein
VTGAPAPHSDFRQVFDAFPSAMLLTGGDGQVERANAKAESLFGYAPAGLNGRPVETVFPDLAPKLIPADPHPEGDAARSVLLVGRRRDASQFPAEVNVFPLRTSGGTATIMVVEDVTGTQGVQFLLHRCLDLLQSDTWDRQALIKWLIQARDDERARIAADIHDDTLQVISAASLRLQKLRLRLQSPEEIRLLDKVGQTLAVSINGLRQIVFDLRPSGVEHGISEAILGQLECMHAETGICYELDDELTVAVPASAAVPTYRIAREAIANVRKHSKARTVRVGLVEVDGGCLVGISDDGIGYNPADVEGRPGHLGLLLARERAQLAGGWCRIESSPGVGTTVDYWIPFDGGPTQPETADEDAG